jgi:carbon-monoxide dehydrogenase medium subunit
VKPASFEYHAPSSVKEAVDLLADLGDSAKVIAGGQSLVPVLAMRLAVFDHLIDIRRIDGLRGIEERDGAVWIGAATTEAEIGRSELIAARVPLLARATPLIGHFQIRNRGTIGGSLAHADAAAEYPAVARPDRRADPRRTVGEPLPLHRLPGNPQGRPRRRQRHRGRHDQSRKR